jgi:hypothetical protein
MDKLAIKSTTKGSVYRNCFLHEGDTSNEKTLYSNIRIIFYAEDTGVWGRYVEI